MGTATGQAAVCLAAVVRARQTATMLPVVGIVRAWDTPDVLLIIVSTCCGVVRLIGAFAADSVLGFVHEATVIWAGVNVVGVVSRTSSKTAARLMLSVASHATPILAGTCRMGCLVIVGASDRIIGLVGTFAAQGVLSLVHDTTVIQAIVGVVGVIAGQAAACLVIFTRVCRSADVGAAASDVSRTGQVHRVAVRIVRIAMLARHGVLDLVTGSLVEASIVAAGVGVLMRTRIGNVGVVLVARKLVLHFFHETHDDLFAG